MTEKKPPKISQENAKKNGPVLGQRNENQAHTSAAAENANQEQASAENANETEEKSLKKNETKEKADEENQAEDTPKKKHKHKKKVVTGESKSHKKKCSCKGCSCCKAKCCPHFPRCCPLPLLNCLQILAAVDLVLLPV